MIRNKLYYTIRPLIPRRLQIALRRQIILRKRPAFDHVWPIDPNAGTPPAGWSGWPGGKKFALVLTHDVETERGQAKCRELMKIEKDLGFRSSFNFVPKRYNVSAELREYLVREGFEVGVHGLYHDGEYYASRKKFRERAIEINNYLKSWEAAGFRSPAMHHNLEWIHDLNIEYDASTFDTDPFEPQPDGMGTIFPFIVNGSASGKSYVELPYTLPQDFTLFTLMKEKDILIWKKKLNWIAERGGMALLITHPDYMNFNDSVCGREEYPARFYRELLSYIKTKYQDQYWQPLPKAMARFWAAGGYADRRSSVRTEDKAVMKNKKIWIDLDNSPHVPFFKPIIEELKKNNYTILLTARDCAQTCALADLNNMQYKRIGRHIGKNKLVKLFGLLMRSLQLLPFILKERPHLALSHGSRAQLVVSFLLRIPAVWMADYEFVRGIVRPTCLMIPEVINAVNFSHIPYIVRYSGIKEDVYVPDFKPAADIRPLLGVQKTERMVTVRPPATDAHYHNPASERLFTSSIEYLCGKEDVRVVMLPRNEKQKDFVVKTWPEWCREKKIIIPDDVVDGLNLIWYSDFVISGGGTMNREAAALGVPVYSIFRGKIGAVDRYLSENGRLTLLESEKDVQTKIKFDDREKGKRSANGDKGTLKTIMNGIEMVIDRMSP